MNVVFDQIIFGNDLFSWIDEILTFVSGKKIALCDQNT